jgi:hypothetical protein
VSTGLPWFWDRIATWIPAGEAIHAPFALAAIVTLANGLAATWVAYQLFRGPGRWWAAVVAGPLTVLSIVHWLLQVGTAEAFPALPFTLAATLSVGVLVRSLVHFGRLTPVASARVLAAAAAAALIAPRPGVPLLCLLATICLLRHIRAADLSADRRRGRQRLGGRLVEAARRSWPVLLTAAVVPGSAALALGEDVPGFGLSVGTLTVGAPPLHELRAHLGVALLYPALALVLLLVAPLRWRGGLSVALLTAGALTVRDDQGSLAPIPVMLVAAATSGAGWVWLAGSLRVSRRLGRALSFAAAVVIAMVGSEPMWAKLHVLGGPPTVASQRAGPSLLRLHDRGLLAPGEVVIAHGNWLRTGLRALQTTEGARPDVLIVDPAALDAISLSMDSVRWAHEKRRILSDSFNLGGRWNAALAVDSGPLFWFVGKTDPEARQFTDLVRLTPVPSPRIPADYARRLEVFHVERARFRRAVDHPADALLALPIEEELQRELLAQIEASRAPRPTPALASELPAMTPDLEFAAGALIRAEVGDLLYGAGLEHVGARLLLEAANGGVKPAWGAFARWRLRSASETAQETLANMAKDPSLRSESVGLLWWMVARGRLADALELRAHLAPVGTAVPEEVGARLAVLTALARRP